MNPPLLPGLVESPPTRVGLLKHRLYYVTCLFSVLFFAVEERKGGKRFDFVQGQVMEDTNM